VSIKASQIDTMKNICSNFAYQLGNEEIPLHKKIKIRLKPKAEFEEDTLLYVASVNKKGKLTFLGNKYVDGFIEAQTNVLGIYIIAKDETKPTIKPLNFKNKGSVAENWSLRVEIEDKETGISRTMLSMILRETRNTTINALQKICNTISNKNPNIDKSLILE
jgi:hypothetical protein